MVQRVEKLGVDPSVTHRTLVLGAQDGETGQYKKHYSSSGELITNGDFETGDSTGWSVTGDGNVGTPHPYEGIYYWRVEGYNASGTIEQSFTYVLPTNSILASSGVFEMYACANSLASPPVAGNLTVTITYTDATTTNINWSGPSGGYEQINIKNYLDANKYIEKISIAMDAPLSTCVWVDFIHCSNDTATFSMIIEEVIAPIINTAAGQYTSTLAIGYTDTEVNECDLIEHPAGAVYVIATVEPVNFGDKNILYRCTMEKQIG